MNMPSYMIEHRWVTKQVDVSVAKPCIKHVISLYRTLPKRGVRTGKCLVSKQSLFIFDHQTFPAWRGLNMHYLIIFMFGLDLPSQ